MSLFSENGLQAIKVNYVKMSMCAMNLLCKCHYWAELLKYIDI